MDRLLEKLVTDVQVDKRTTKHEFLGPEKLIEYFCMLKTLENLLGS